MARVLLGVYEAVGRAAGKGDSAEVARLTPLLESASSLCVCAVGEGPGCGGGSESRTTADVVLKDSELGESRNGGDVELTYDTATESESEFGSDGGDGVDQFAGETTEDEDGPLITAWDALNSANGFGSVKKKRVSFSGVESLKLNNMVAGEEGVPSAAEVATPVKEKVSKGREKGASRIVRRDSFSFSEDEGEGIESVVTPSRKHHHHHPSPRNGSRSSRKLRSSARLSKVTSTFECDSPQQGKESTQDDSNLSNEDETDNEATPVGKLKSKDVSSRLSSVPSKPSRLSFAGNDMSNDTSDVALSVSEKDAEDLSREDADLKTCTSADESSLGALKNKESPTLKQKRSRKKESRLSFIPVPSGNQTTYSTPLIRTMKPSGLPTRRYQSRLRSSDKENVVENEITSVRKTRSQNNK
jgi:hypothetical protein